MAQELPKNRNTSFPYDAVTQPSHSTGDKDDTARYLLAPGIDFFRAYLSVPGGGPAFVWPGGVEGWSHRIDPALGIHRYIGGSVVAVDITHKGQEGINLSGVFPGLTSDESFRALRDVIYADIPDGGYILYVPHLYDNTLRVFVQGANFDHAQDERTRNINYSIDFVYVAEGNPVDDDPNLRTDTPSPTPAKPIKGKPPHKFTVNAKTNTLQKIAASKLGSAKKWDVIYDKNKPFFQKKGIPLYKVPAYRLKPGDKINY